MSVDSINTYDEVPYESKPLFSTHPDCLCAAARLRGLAAAAPSRCRVLELGCAGGGNLIPMAYGLPQSQFVGIDLSQRQIADGQAVIKRLELSNIELRAASIADVDRSWGQFDYIICHGVYSWVPPPIQEHILWICGHLLAPAGVAYVSYNTYPGWHLRSVVRDLMKFHTARFDDPQTKVQQARSILNFMAKASAGTESPLSKLLAEEAASLPEAADYYLYHEHLEDSNQPLYFHQFVSRARASGLEYLGEAWHHSQIDNLPADVQETLQAISRDLIDLEQFTDFMRSRTFRRTLLCHSEAKFSQTPEPDVIEPMLITALARPQTAKPDVKSDQPEKFVLDDGTTASTKAPIFKAALLELFERWPAAVPFGELFDAAAGALQLDQEQRAAPRALLAALLVRGYIAHLVAIHCEPFPFVPAVSERPRASRLARLMAGQQTRVPTLRHRMVILPPLDRAVLKLADGTRSTEQIDASLSADQRELVEQALAGNKQLADGRAAVADSLHRLARAALLET
jgi:methyltransferase-like protein